MEKTFTPFTPEQVENLNKFQNQLIFHPFTCNGSNIPECERRSKVSEGILTATPEGWICPCGKYTQNWAHKFMAENL